MRTNIITAAASDTTTVVTSKAYQYDYGLRLEVTGLTLPNVTEWQFSNTASGEAAKTTLGDATGCDVPNELLISGQHIYAWLFVHSGTDDGYTAYTFDIPVQQRTRPIEEEPTPEQAGLISQAVAALNAAVEQTALDVIATGEDVTAAAESARQAGLSEESAYASAQAAAGSVSEISDYATAAYNSKVAAQTAQGKAEDAQTAAETAQGKAEDAQSAADDARDLALGAKADAIDAKDTAVSKAGEASQSATDASGYATTASNKATEASTNALKAEGYAVGKQNGSDVSSGTYYHNNAKYYSDAASGSATTATTKAGEASTSAQTSEAYAIGKRNGTAVGSSDPAYHNNSKYYADQAASVASSIPADYTTLSNDVTGLKADLSQHSNIINANLMGIDVQENLYPGAADWSGTWSSSDTINIKPSQETFMNYPVMYSSQSWRRYYKEIPVEAGKTYTFEAWMKHATEGAAFLYLIWANHTTNPATLSVSSKQFNNVAANTWTKLSVTFTCSVSGNISPYILSGTSAFYFAKYVLVEGDKAFSLSDELADRATLQDVSGIGDYEKHDFSLGTSSGNYWNPTITKNVKAGTKIRLYFDSYSGSYLNYVRLDGQKSDNSWTGGLCKITAPFYKGASAECIISENYKTLRFQFYRTTDESNVNATIYLATNSELGLTTDVLGMSAGKIINIDKNGNGDFTSFVEGVNYACQFLDSIVYVSPGEYDVIDEFGSDYMSAVDSSHNWGLELKNRVHIIGSSKTVIKAINENTEENTNFSNIKEYFSIFNAGALGFTIENLTLVDDSIRYSVHDDRGGAGPVPYRNHYINCSMSHKNGMYSDCIGAGIGEDGYIEIRGCFFDGDVTRNGQPVTRYVYWHGNNNSSVTNAKGRIYVTGCYFTNNGTFKLTRYGNSTAKTIAYISGNSFGSQPEITNGSYPTPIIDNMEMVAWNNEIRT